MTETTKEIFEKHQVRINKKQKKNFRNYLETVCTANGYEYKEEKGMFGAKNVVIGDVENAKIIYTAHYDTQPILPFPYIVMPKKPILTILLQCIFILGLLAIGILSANLICLVLKLCGVPIFILKIIFYILVGLVWLYLLLSPYLGVANKHTANDNTSGVTTLIDIMTSLPKTNRHNVAFVFFDLEELGLLGSYGFANKHKNIQKNSLIVNFDCVSNGKKILFVVLKKAKKYKDVLEKSFVSSKDLEVEFASKWVYYPSDQSSFKCGVGVAALNKKGKIEYLNKIHSSKDTIYQEENITFLVKGAKKLINELNKTENQPE